MNLHPPSQCLNIIKLNIEYKKKIIKKKKKKKKQKRYAHTIYEKRYLAIDFAFFKKKKKIPI